MFLELCSKYEEPQHIEEDMGKPTVDEHIGQELPVEAVVDDPGLGQQRQVGSGDRDHLIQEKHKDIDRDYYQSCIEKSKPNRLADGIHVVHNNKIKHLQSQCQPN